MQGKRRIDAYFDWVEEENWRTRFPFGTNVQGNHDKNVSKKCKSKKNIYIYIYIDKITNSRNV